MQKYANIAIKSMNYHINVLNSQYLHFELLARYFGPHHNLAELYKMLGQYDMAKFYLEKLADEMQPNIFRAEQQGNRDTYSYMLGQQASIRLRAKMFIIEQLESEGKLALTPEEKKTELNRIKRLYDESVEKANEEAKKEKTKKRIKTVAVLIIAAVLIWLIFF
jgi:tetratricopeptide (TPR) repeat protein